MNEFLRLITLPTTSTLVHQGLLFLRVGIGILSIFHGAPKIMGGVDKWYQLGHMAMSPLGIHFFYTFWGFMAAFTEFFGGIALILGFCMRPVNSLFVITMIVAAYWHIQKGDPFTVYSFALSLIVVHLAFVIIGGDQYSMDYYLHNAWR
jgi:putative oxidoreductase